MSGCEIQLKEVRQSSGTGSFGSFVGKLTLHFEKGKLVDEHYELIEADPNRFPANEELQSIIEKKKINIKKNLKK